MAPTTRAAALALLVLLQLAGPAAATRLAAWRGVGAEGNGGAEGRGEEVREEEQAEAQHGGEDKSSDGAVAQEQEQEGERTLKEVQMRAGGMLQKTGASRQQHDSERAQACCCMDKWTDGTTPLTSAMCNTLHDIRPMKKHYWNAAAGKCCWIKKNGLCMPTWVVIFPMGNGGTRQANMDLCTGKEAPFLDNKLAFAKNVVQLNHQAGQQMFNKLKSVTASGTVIALEGTCLLDAGGVNIDVWQATDVVQDTEEIRQIIEKAVGICSKLAKDSKGPKCSTLDCNGPGGVVAPVQEDEDDDGTGGR